jgi:hypothetical protein
MGRLIAFSAFLQIVLLDNAGTPAALISGYDRFRVEPIR